MKELSVYCVYSLMLVRLTLVILKDTCVCDIGMVMRRRNHRHHHHHQEEYIVIVKFGR